MNRRPSPRSRSIMRRRLGKDPSTSCRGLSLTELIVTAAILSVMAAIAVPFAKLSVQRKKEAELRYALRTLRNAIDAYHRDAVPPDGSPPKIGLQRYGSEGYPESLEVLVEGVYLVNSVKKKRYLRRIPRDPMTNSREWGLRCVSDPPDSTTWCGDNVYDVYSKSHARALDGSRYNEW